jgi:hypothetical protein
MIHPHFVTLYRLDDQSALFTPRNDRVYSHYEFHLFFDGDGERVTAALLGQFYNPRAATPVALKMSSATAKS